VSMFFAKRVEEMLERCCWSSIPLCRLL